MGSMKDLLFDAMEERDDRRLAEKLGITYDELTSCEWTVEQDTSNDDIVYRTYIQFDESSPEDVLQKIKGLGPDLQYDLQEGDFEDDEDFEEMA